MTMPQAMTNENGSRCGIATSDKRVPPISTAQGIETCRAAVTAATVPPFAHWRRGCHRYLVGGACPGPDPNGGGRGAAPTGNQPVSVSPSPATPAIASSRMVIARSMSSTVVVNGGGNVITLPRVVLKRNQPARHSYSTRSEASTDGFLVS